MCTCWRVRLPTFRAVIPVGSSELLDRAASQPNWVQSCVDGTAFDTAAKCGSAEAVLSPACRDAGAAPHAKNDTEQTTLATDRMRVMVSSRSGSCAEPAPAIAGRRPTLSMRRPEVKDRFPYIDA